MSAPLLDPAKIQSADGPVLIAVELSGDVTRVTGSHCHARGQIFGALRGLLSVGTDDSQWVVPAIHAVWLPPNRSHSVRSHGAFAGWSVYVTESACADLPHEPCTIRTSGLLREAVSRAATWEGGVLDNAQMRLASVILDEIRSLPREAFGLPMPRDVRVLRIARALADNLADNRRLDEWAEWGGVAPRTLTRRFIDETGFSFSEWRQRARLIRALEMLASGTAVTTIALDLGYENVSAFIAMFRRTFGVTPTQYFVKLIL
ncbi:AraC-like DNA-binding protein [Caballeronia udeis]|uniref:AraC-like DNA-binding protein n=1 Tax=Caballeronia udeis TaxID=1232866 RepID=A0ABW8MDE3_9BURK